MRLWAWHSRAVLVGFRRLQPPEASESKGGPGAMVASIEENLGDRIGAGDKGGAKLRW